MGMVKNSNEIKLLKKSAKITDSCIKIIKDSLREDITEIELRRRINRNIRRQGASLAFQTLVASGKRSAMVHAKPRATKKVIKGIGLVDFGACYKGYLADVTVPFIKGKISNREKRIIDTTLKAYEISIKSIKLDDFCWVPFKVVNEYLKSKKFEMKHALGHGIGKKVHEYPILVMPKKKKLRGKKKKRWEKIKKIKFQKNMVLAIEPGVYVKGIGGCRIENDFLLTKRGPKALTHSKLIKA